MLSFIDIFYRELEAFKDLNSKTCFMEHALETLTSQVVFFSSDYATECWTKSFHS